ncbi:hypothetical protein LXL04_039320 [Taraxacum kok-saghyz]
MTSDARHVRFSGRRDRSRKIEMKRRFGDVEITLQQLALKTLSSNNIDAFVRTRKTPLFGDAKHPRSRKNKPKVNSGPCLALNLNFTMGIRLCYSLLISLSMISIGSSTKSFENSYIPENPRTPKPLTFSKNRLRGAKNRSNISPVAKTNFRKNDFFFSKNFAYVQTFFLCICAQSFYNTYLKRFVKKNLKKNAKKKSCTYAQKIKKSCTYAKVKKKYRFFGNFFQRIVMIKNVLEGSEVGFLKGITVNSGPCLALNLNFTMGIRLCYSLLISLSMIYIGSSTKLNSR